MRLLSPSGPSFFFSPMAAELPCCVFQGPCTLGPDGGPIILTDRTQKQMDRPDTQRCTDNQRQFNGGGKQRQLLKRGPPTGAAAHPVLQPGKASVDERHDDVEVTEGKIKSRRLAVLPIFVVGMEGIIFLLHRHRVDHIVPPGDFQMEDIKRGSPLSSR